MRTTMLCAAAALVLGGGPAFAASATTSSGSVALALGALVGRIDPHLTCRDRRALADMLDGRLNFSFPAGGAITVTADAVTCRASDVDISHHDCALTFSRATRTLQGRAAHEVDATLIENGVPSDGAAGSIFESLTHLKCIVKPAEVKQRGGGGAACTWSSGP